MGGVRLADGIQLSVVAGIDDHSRFCVIAKVIPRATARMAAPLTSSRCRISLKTDTAVSVTWSMGSPPSAPASRQTLSP
jgi:hypothetical protein